jgi:hypothetical protein
VLVEDKANGSSVVKHLKEEISGLIAVNPEGGKVSRMIAASPEFQSHNWFFDRTGAWTNKAVEQLCLFPNARNDDISDAVSQAAIWLQANTYELGLLDYFKDLLTGKRKPPTAVEQMRGTPVKETKAPTITVEGWKKWVEKGQAPPCSRLECKSISTVILGSVVHCNSCGADDGVLRPKAEISIGQNCCDAPLPQVSGQKCGNCGREVSRPATETDFQQRARTASKFRNGQNALSVHFDDPVSRWFRQFDRR